MQDKLIEILSGATGWMTANKLAEKGGWRSPAHVGLALKQMPGVEHRKSATEKMGNGMPATEYKLKDKVFLGDSAPGKSMEKAPACVQQSAKSETQKPLTVAGETQSSGVRKNRTTQPEPVFTQPAHDNEMADLRAKLALAEKQRNDHFNRAESLQLALERSDATLGILGTMLINIEGDGIGEKLGKVLHERLHSEKKIADLEDDVRRHCNSLQHASTTVIRFLIATHQLTGFDHKPSDLNEAEQQIAQAMHNQIRQIEELEAQLKDRPVMAGPGAQDDHAGPFVVRTPSRPPRFTKKHKNAHAVAMSAARRHGFAEVFALVPVGKAVRGAEWKEVA